jgi:CDGSH-type Zn-finger protein
VATKITVINNGPIRVEGEDIELYDVEGGRYGLAGRTRISLCRCGKSENKPFCDGKHGVTGFESLCQATELPPPVIKPAPTQ